MIYRFGASNSLNTRSSLAILEHFFLVLPYNYTEKRLIQSGKMIIILQESCNF